MLTLDYLYIFSVACRQMGYNNGGRVLNAAYYGEGTSPISDLYFDCVGTETEL